MLDDEAGNEKADEVDGVVDAGRQKVVVAVVVVVGAVDV